MLLMELKSANSNDSEYGDSFSFIGNSTIMSLAPIVLFVYNRPWHTQQTVEALQKNELAKESELFIYCDAAKDDATKQVVDEVRIYIRSVDGFKKITIVEREVNWGLADSIIDGVTEVVNQHGKIIVLEDDLVTSPYFLKFMNEALDFYKNEKKVWHISGWNYPINVDGLNDVFLWRLMNCWGWATWANRWKYFEKNTAKVIREFTKNEINYLNLDGSGNAWSQVISNKKGKINTWAIYWYATIVKKNGLCLNPAKAFVDNIGMDGSGVNCGSVKAYKCILLDEYSNHFVLGTKEDALALKKIKNFHKDLQTSFMLRIVNKIKRVLIVK
jgi:hypothetical protein